MVIRDVVCKTVLDIVKFSSRDNHLSVQVCKLRTKTLVFKLRRIILFFVRCLGYCALLKAVAIYTANDVEKHWCSHWAVQYATVVYCLGILFFSKSWWCTGTAYYLQKHWCSKPGVAQAGNTIFVWYCCVGGQVKPGLSSGL